VIFDSKFFREFCLALFGVISLHLPGLEMKKITPSMFFVVQFSVIDVIH